MHSESEDRRKPQPKRRRRTSGRFSHHTCFHHDWWNGCLGMPPEEVGVYERLYKLMYIRRSALVDNDKELAQLCHCDVRTYKRIKAKLIARGRIVQDQELGILYDERTIRELNDSGFLSEEQTRRAIKRHAKTPVKTLLDERHRSDAGNVVELHPDKVLSVAQVLRKVGENVETSLSEVDTVIGQNQRDECANEHAIQYPLSITQPTCEQKPEPPAPRAALPPRGGGATAALDELSVAERQARIRAQFPEAYDQGQHQAEPEVGKEGGAVEPQASGQIGELRPGVDSNEHRNRIIAALRNEPGHHDAISDHVPHFAPDRTARRG